MAQIFPSSGNHCSIYTLALWFVIYTATVFLFYVILRFIGNSDVLKMFIIFS